MGKVETGRFTAGPEGSFVVFAIGMRINRFLAVRDWLPTAMAMSPMLKELYRNPEKGFLGAEYFLSSRGPMILQYWRSFEDLEKFARDPNAPHLPAWRRFNQKAKRGGSVGIWHETYTIDPGHHETVYSNMPPFGLAKATERVPVNPATSDARARIERKPGRSPSGDS